MQNINNTQSCAMLFLGTLFLLIIVKAVMDNRNVEGFSVANPNDPRWSQTGALSTPTTPNDVVIPNDPLPPRGPHHQPSGHPRTWKGQWPNWPYRRGRRFGRHGRYWPGRWSGRYSDYPDLPPYYQYPVPPQQPQPTQPTQPQPTPEPTPEPTVEVKVDVQEDKMQKYLLYGVIFVLLGFLFYTNRDKF